MEISFTTDRSSDKLIIIFLGWGMEPSALAGVTKPAYDIVAVSDYRTVGQPDAWAELARLAAGYGEVVIVAWSFGVRAAADFLLNAENGLTITRRIAVNGTPAHIHDRMGIPEAIFKGTLANLSESTLRKFRRRMFASADAFAEFQSRDLKRTFDSLREELELFGHLAPVTDGNALFDIAVTGGQDAIFPPAGQLAYWGVDKVDFQPGMPHFPDFDMILRRHVIDKALVAERFSASSATYRDNAPVQTRVAARLWEYAAPYASGALDAGGPVLEVGVGKGLLTQTYAPVVDSRRMMLWDIADMDSTLLPEGAVVRQCDAEVSVRELADNSLSMLLSASTIQWFNNPEEFIRQGCRKLLPGGMLAVASFGPKTFREISDVTGTGLRYPDPEALARIARESGCRVAVSHEETSVQRFGSPRELLRHLKLTGVNAVSRGGGETAAAMRLLKSLGQSASEPALTYQPVYLVAIKVK